MPFTLEITSESISLRSFPLTIHSHFCFLSLCCSGSLGLCSVLLRGAYLLIFSRAHRFRFNRIHLRNRSNGRLSNSTTASTCLQPIPTSCPSSLPPCDRTNDPILLVLRIRLRLLSLGELRGLRAIANEGLCHPLYFLDSWDCQFHDEGMRIERGRETGKNAEKRRKEGRRDSRSVHEVNRRKRFDGLA